MDGADKPTWTYSRRVPQSVAPPARPRGIRSDRKCENHPMTAPIDFVVAIPARHASTRLPGKPLQPIPGDPMILHVAPRALAAGPCVVRVATDDQRIADALEDTVIQDAITSPDHPSGTARLAECADIAGWSDVTVVVNHQGDEPFSPAAGIRAVATTLV